MLSQGGNSAWTQVPLRRTSRKVGEQFSSEIEAWPPGYVGFVADVLPGSESWRESRMREIRTSGLTRGEGCHAALRDRSLSYSTASPRI
jgi:hypothetical protein